jgi:hypothetical protein
MASYLGREGEHNPAEFSSGWRHELSRGRFQRHLSLVTFAWAFFCGFEAWYSHYKSNFQYRSQWIPVLLAPAIMLAAGAAVVSRSAARTLLPAASIAAIAVGSLGSYFYPRGIARRAGGIKPLYNTIYGPPIFAPLLFAACGTLGCSPPCCAEREKYER